MASDTAQLQAKCAIPEELLSTRHHLALVFRQRRAAGVEKSQHRY